MHMSSSLCRPAARSSIAATAVLIGLVGLGATAVQASDAGGILERLTIADLAEPTTLDPTVSRTFTNRHNYEHLFEPLVHRAPDGKLVGRVAERWEYLSDTHIRFYIRRGLQFHNGEPVDANAVKYSLDRYRNPAVSEAAARLSTVSTVEAVDDYTVDAITAKPDPILLSNLADGLFPVPPKAHSDLGPEKFARNPIGSGPWMFVRWDPGERIVAKRYDAFHRGPALSKELVLRFISDDSTRISALLAGDVDVIRGVPAAHVERVKKSNRANIVSAPATRSTYIGINFPTHKSVDDKRVRQALNYAIDLDAIVEVVLHGHGYPSGQHCFEGCFGYNPTIKPYPYDVEKAKQLLRDAGYRAGELKLAFDYPLGQIPNSGDIAQALAAMWQIAGINVTLNPLEWGAFWTRLNSKPENLGELFMMYSNAPGADASEVIQPYLVQNSRWNWTGYHNPEIEALVLRAGSMVDPQLREPIYHDLARRLHDDAVYVFLSQWVNLYGVRKGLKLVPRADTQIMAYDYVAIEK